MPVDQTFSVWRRSFTLEPHHTEWQEFILADEADEIIGVIKVMESPPGSKNCWLESVKVNKEFRNRGWGSKLLEIAADYAKNQGCKCIRGQVKPEGDLSSNNLLNFYMKNGFSIIREADAFHPVIIKYLGS